MYVVARRRVISIYLYLFLQHVRAWRAGGADRTGAGAGAGFNVNIPWPTHGLGDIEYAAAMENIVVPLLAEFKPELILVSCGESVAFLNSRRCCCCCSDYAVIWADTRFFPFKILP